MERAFGFDLAFDTPLLRGRAKRGGARGSDPSPSGAALGVKKFARLAFFKPLLENQGIARAPAKNWHNRASRDFGGVHNIGF